jgi:hypothetical protein
VKLTASVNHLGVIVAVLLPVLPGQPANSPSRDRARQLDHNTNQLRVTVALDRAEYIPGETATATITVSNPTSSALEAFEPFRGNTGRLHVAVQQGQERATRYRPNDATFDRSGATNTYWFAAAEKRTFQISSLEHIDTDPFPAFSVPDDTGDYQLEYRYSYGTVRESAAKFRVVPVVTTSVSFAGLAQPLQYNTDGRTVTLPRNVVLLVLKGPSKYYVAASLREFSSAFIQRLPDGSFFNGPADYSPLVRVAESAEPIVTVSGVEISAGPSQNGQRQEVIAVTWTTVEGKQSSVRFGANRAAVP